MPRDMNRTPIAVLIVAALCGCTRPDSANSDGPFAADDLARGGPADLAGRAGELGRDADQSTTPAIVFQCSQATGGICTMNADGSNRQVVLDQGREPDCNRAGEIVFTDPGDSVIKKIRADKTIVPLGPGAFARWTPSGDIVFQGPTRAGGINIMKADGSQGQVLFPTGWAPDANAAGEIVFYDDTGIIKKLLMDKTVTALGTGDAARWAPDGRIIFQCMVVGGGICRMNADGSGREVLRGSGSLPNGNAAGEILFFDDSFAVNKVLADGKNTVSLGPGIYPSWTR